ncbi:lung adenoma susceptibility protein 2 [Phyllobates terribilis]|uniref:lung adenoma susceptibility protein 2 n=1 Tax=Phyllobates terribilis TaxID=111132 RepID=UPI003CCAB393
MAGSRSPDSSISISSLLASCSLGSNSRSDAARPPASIQYKDRLYDSASRALEDYIVDYEAASTGRITVHPSSTLPTPRRRAHPSICHTRSLTRSGYSAPDPDLLSLTTDDLLGFPPDGSLPFSQASQERKRRKNLKKQLGFSPRVTALASPLTPSSLRAMDVSALDLRDHRLRSQDLQRREEKSHPDRENYSGLYNIAHPLLYKAYPRWLTSNKSELGVSGVSSIPDIKYPLWLRDHGLLGDVDSRWTMRRDAPFTNIPNHPSDSPSQRFAQRGDILVNSSIFTERVKSSARSDLDIMQHFHTLVKSHPEAISEQTGGAAAHKDLSQQPPHHNQSPRTEDVLEAERSWERVPYSYKSPVQVLCENEENKGLKALKSNLGEDFLKDCVQQENTANPFSGGNHHGPVEALKHMLFNLQAFQQNISQETGSEHLQEIQKISTEVESEIQKVDQEIFPVNKSLQKALHHLSRLKELVGDCNLKNKEDDLPGLRT